MNKEDLKRKQQEVKEAWEFVMAAPQGRAVIGDILRMSGLRQSPFNGATNQTIKNVGMQDLGRMIELTVKQLAFDDYMKLLKEENEHGR